MIKYLVGLLLLASCLTTDGVSITEQQTTSADNSKFSCKMTILMKSNDDTWTKADGHNYVELYWSETQGDFVDGSELNLCDVKVGYDGSDNLVFADGALESRCQVIRYNGDSKKWEGLVTADTSKFEIKCTNPTTKSKKLKDYSCTIFFDKDENLGLSSGLTKASFQAEPTDALSTETEAEVAKILSTETKFESDMSIDVKFGDKTCSFAFIAQMTAGLISLTTLLIF